jgi:hypothetical protein
VSGTRHDPSERKVLLSVLVYQNDTLSKPTESGEIAQHTRDCSDETLQISLKRERLMP